jgi:hypothetical protein
VQNEVVSGLVQAIKISKKRPRQSFAGSRRLDPKNSLVTDCCACGDLLESLGKGGKVGSKDAFLQTPQHLRLSKNCSSMVFSFARRFAGSEKPSQDSVESIIGEPFSVYDCATFVTGLKSATCILTTSEL